MQRNAVMTFMVPSGQKIGSQKSVFMQCNIQDKNPKTQSQSAMCNDVLRASEISGKRTFFELYIQMTRKLKFSTGENMQHYKP